MSFAIDPPLLVASGAAIEASGIEPEVGDKLGVATVATFAGLSVLLYSNAPALRPLWRAFGARSGREFMLTSGLADLDEASMNAGRHALALSQFLLYPAWLALGRALVRAR